MMCERQILMARCRGHLCCEQAGCLQEPLVADRRIDAGECVVQLSLEPRIIADYDTRLPGWRIAGGKYRVSLARDAADRTIVSTATLEPATMKP